MISKTGQIITPEMCVEPRRPGKVIVIDKIILYADCPNLEYLDNFLANELIQSITDNLDNPISTVIHSCSFQVLESERYARWLRKFPQTTKHLILCNGLHSNNGIFYSSDELLNVLGEISDFFKVHTHKDTAALPDSIVEVDNCRIANNYRSHQLEPSVMEYDAYKSSFNVVKCEEFESTVAELHTNLHGQDSNQDCLDSRYIVTLGTGSCMPGKLRNGDLMLT